MNEGLVTKRYVKAIYQLAEEEGIQEKVKGDIQSLYLCIQESPEFVEFLGNPLIKPRQKKQLFTKIFGDVFQSITLNFLLMVVENRREMHLKSICLHYLQFFKSLMHIKEAVITTAVPLSSEYISEIHEFFTRKFKMKIELEEKVNPSIIGGFILRIEDQQIDASIQSQLRKIQRELVHH
jgi:F-type H+-transporting ATPase subunit delta